jgi:hypothetical protein
MAVTLTSCVSVTVATLVVQVPAPVDLSGLSNLTGLELLPPDHQRQIHLELRQRKTGRHAHVLRQRVRPKDLTNGSE